jgi:hypothetical protein
MSLGFRFRLQGVDFGLLGFTATRQGLRPRVKGVRGLGACRVLVCAPPTGHHRGLQLLVLPRVVNIRFYSV